MSFWSLLGKIGAGVAAPFTGGASLAAIPAIDSLSSVLGKQEQGAATGRQSQAELQQGQDRNAVSLYGTQQGAQNSAAQTDLERKNYTDQALTSNAKHALLASLLGGGKMGGSISIPGITNATVSGGPMAALAQNPEALAALKSFGDQSTQKLNTAPTFTGGEVLKPPSLTPLPEQSSTSSFLSTLARIGQLAGTAGGQGGNGMDTVQMTGYGPLDGTPDEATQAALLANQRRAGRNVSF